MVFVKLNLRILRGIKFLQNLRFGHCTAIIQKWWWLSGWHHTVQKH